MVSRCRSNACGSRSMARSRAGTMCRATAARSPSSRRSPVAEMPRFELSDTPFDTGTLRARLLDARVGGYASFEGWVRDQNDGRAVHGLHYEAYAALAAAEGERVLAEALPKLDI